MHQQPLVILSRYGVSSLPWLAPLQCKDRIKVSSEHLAVKKQALGIVDKKVCCCRGDWKMDGLCHVKSNPISVYLQLLQKAGETTALDSL
jgi:acyl dehydratase